MNPGPSLTRDTKRARSVVASRDWSRLWTEVVHVTKRTGGVASRAMFALNRVVLYVLLDLAQKKGSAMVVVTAASARRVIHVANGQLVGCESNIKSERVGDMLVSEGLLDPVLLEPVAAEATRKGVRLGDQMVADGLLTQEELHRALERQVVVRMSASLSMRGQVTVEPPKFMQGTADVPLRVAVVWAFRKGIPLKAIEIQLLANEEKAPPHPEELERLLGEMELGPAEVRIARRILGGEALDAIISSGAPREPVFRLAGALRAVNRFLS